MGANPEKDPCNAPGQTWCSLTLGEFWYVYFACLGLRNSNPKLASFYGQSRILVCFASFNISRSLSLSGNASPLGAVISRPKFVLTWCSTRLLLPELSVSNDASE